MRSELKIRAPRHLVWSTLADLEGVSRWNPGIKSAECTTDNREGLGATRRCHMRPSGWMTETISEWQPERVIGFAIENAPPIKTGQARFVLSDSGDGAVTILEASFEYEVRFGPLGPVIDRLVVQRQFASAWPKAMEGLRLFAEDLSSTAA